MKSVFSIISVVLIISNPAFAWDTNAKKVKGADLAVETHKYDDRLIQTTANCFLADKADIRCLADLGARIDFSVINGDGMEDYLFDKCDSIDNLIGPKCRFDIQFTYSGFSAQPTPSGGSMTLVEPAGGAGEFKRHKK